MKKTIIVIVLVLFMKVTDAQNCVISGKSKNIKDTTLFIYLLTADGHYKHQFVEMPVKNGKFSKEIPLQYPLFALITFDNKERRLLLSPGRSISLVIDGSKEENAISISGKGAAENNIIEELKLGSVPFFMQEDWTANRFVKISEDSIQQMVFQPVQQQVKASLQKINGSAIPGNIKRLLADEVKYSLQCYLYDFAGNYMRWAKNAAQESIMKKAMEWQPLPDSLSLVSGFYANMMLSNQQRNALNELGKDFRKDSVTAKKRIENSLLMSYAEIGRQVNKYGERYILPWLYAKQHLSKAQQEKTLFNAIMQCCSDKNLAIANVLMDTLYTYFTTSHYRSMAVTEVNKMDVVLNQQVQNKKIVFYPDAKPGSLQELIRPYKGKIIYLDIWGTWCGPCRIEMNYVAELKKKYIGRDIVFLYLDMDADDKMDRWKEFVQLYGIEGEHYHMNSKEIENCWKEIEAAGGKINLYPTYVVFDKEGKIVHANAERPSSKEILYKQLDEVL